MATESGGDYNAVNKSSGALGKYQIMPANIPSWSKQILGFSITPAQFLASPNYQDLIGQGMLQASYAKYNGDAGRTAAAWFAGDAGSANWQSNPKIVAYVNKVLGSSGAGGVSSGGSSAAAAPQGYTVDGHLIVPGTPEDRYYQMANAIWKNVYGGNAPYSVVAAMKAAGVENVDQVNTLLKEMPSHIAGWSIGQYENIMNAAQDLASKAFGRPVPDSLIKQFAAQGIDDPGQVKLWFDSHPASAMPKEEYQQIFDIANQRTMGLVGQPPDPTTVYNLSVGGGGVGGDIFPVIPPPQNTAQLGQESRVSAHD